MPFVAVRRRAGVRRDGYRFVTDMPALIFYALLLILPVSALVARRVPTATLMKMALIWVAVFGLGAAIVHTIK